MIYNIDYDNAPRLNHRTHTGVLNRDNTVYHNIGTESIFKHRVEMSFQYLINISFQCRQYTYLDTDEQTDVSHLGTDGRTDMSHLGTDGRTCHMHYTCRQ